MNRFAIKLLVFVVFAGLTHLIAGYHMNGHTDTNYLRFTPSGNKGLIMGNSRAAQAICPDDLSAHDGDSLMLTAKGIKFFTFFTDLGLLWVQGLLVMLLLIILRLRSLMFSVCY